MPGRADMERREQFLREYQTQVLDKLVLPPGLREQYSPQACLKDGERQVYLVRDQSGWPAVLKLQPRGARTRYDRNMTFCGVCGTPNFPSHGLSGMGGNGVSGSGVCGRGQPP